ncbi:cytochrome P450 [Microbacterium hominis]|uniref:Cytochrome P450 n=1 Tax=Microbacterium hominis TaxID=162426 RepID=A0A7D4TFN1_9MICO|nr:cytochrome P450 [Microbacterium hominis]QKJ18681.1 cytochrome P450 [Microbacterium hominis]
MEPIADTAQHPLHPARDGAGRLLLTRHAEVVAAAVDPTLFSSAVSAHLQVPNGLDGDGHAAVRRALDPFFAPDALAPLVAQLARVAGELVARQSAHDAHFDAVADLGARFAVRGQALWLGWPEAIDDILLQWVADSRAAARGGDRTALAAAAERFDAIVRGILDDRRATPARDDVTGRLMAVRLDGGRRFTDAELVSVLRNWTGGDLSSLALCAGVIVHWLAAHPDEQRALAEAPDEELDAAIDEILRIDDPFVSNRRVATRDTVVGGCPVAAGEHVVLHWRHANRDPDAVPEPTVFRPAANAAANLVWGIGPHACPGRPLATAELRVLVRALLRAGTIIPEGEAVREIAPVAGFRTVPVRIVPHG